MTSKIIEILKSGSITVPMVLITSYKKLKISEKELIMIIYLINNKEFDPERISKDLGIKPSETLNIIDKLTKKDLLKIETTSGNIYEEYINLDELYNKLALIIINEKEEKQTSIYDKFEREFARTLSPIEYEIIGAWLDNNYKEEIIEAALKEAIYNGVTNLKYIDKILSEWRKKGIKDKSDIKEKNKKKDQKKEVFEYDWLNE